MFYTFWLLFPSTFRVWHPLFPFIWYKYIPRLLLVWLVLSFSYLALTRGAHMALILKNAHLILNQQFYLLAHCKIQTGPDHFSCLSHGPLPILPASGLIQLPHSCCRHTTTQGLFREHTDMDIFKGLHFQIFSFRIYLKLISWHVYNQPLFFANCHSLNLKKESLPK